MANLASILRPTCTLSSLQQVKVSPMPTLFLFLALSLSLCVHSNQPMCWYYKLISIDISYTLLCKHLFYFSMHKLFLFCTTLCVAFWNKKKLYKWTLIWYPVASMWHKVKFSCKVTQCPRGKNYEVCILSPGMLLCNSGSRYVLNKCHSAIKMNQKHILRSESNIVQLQ